MEQLFLSPQECEFCINALIFNGPEHFGITGSEVFFLLRLLKYQKLGRAVPSEDTLAKRCGMSKSGIQKMKRRLSEKAKWKGKPLLTWQAARFIGDKRKHSRRAKHCIYNLTAILDWAQTIYGKESPEIPDHVVLIHEDEIGWI